MSLGGDAWGGHWGESWGRSWFGSADLGGMAKKRRARRYEIVIDDVRFLAYSPGELAAKVRAWRQDHPAPTSAAPTEPRSGPEKPVVPSGRRTAAARAIPKITVLPALVRADSPPGRVVAFAAMARQRWLDMEIRGAAIAAQGAWEAAQLQALEEEEDDIEAIMAILRLVA